MEKDRGDFPHRFFCFPAFLAADVFFFGSLKVWKYPTVMLAALQLPPGFWY
jgi:hypothetical protein